MRSYRVHDNRGRGHTTATMGDFGDANRWAMQYARGLAEPAVVTVFSVARPFDAQGRVVARYLADGEGRCRHVPQLEIGESFCGGCGFVVRHCSCKEG